MSGHDFDAETVQAGGETAPAFPAPAYVASYRARMVELREEFAVRAAVTGPSAEAREWSEMGVVCRAALNLVAGIGSPELSPEQHFALAQRQWAEVPDAEKAELRTVARGMRRALMPLEAMVA